MFIKICGITNISDARAVARTKASAIGFIAYSKSKRFVSPEVVRSICNELKENTLLRKAVVSVDSDISELLPYIKAGTDTIQLHGNESPEIALNIRCQLKPVKSELEVWKAIKPGTKSEIIPYKNYPADKFVIDTFTSHTPGGTGMTCNWDIAAYAVKILQAPVILAGGLNCQNVGAAIKKVKPFGVDVSSGVEIFPGKKSHDLIKQFIDICHQNSTT